MERIALTDGSGQWFDMDKTEEFKEAEYWDGNNHISKATGSQWEHERLYRTASGRWILNHWSQWQGSIETYIEINDDEAARWLVINEQESAIVKDIIENLEL